MRMKSLVFGLVAPMLLSALGCGALVSSADVQRMPPSWSRPPNAARTDLGDPSVRAANVQRIRPSSVSTCDRNWPAPAAEREVLSRVNAQRARGAICGNTRFAPAPPRCFTS
jgi:hypothetical protein